MTVVTAAIVLRAWMAADAREAARLDRQLLVPSPQGRS
jgi:hypothetical protein